MIPESLFSVTRNEYKVFVEQIKPDCRRVEEVELSNNSTAIKIFSNKTGKCLCSRVSYTPLTEGEECRPEEYYIFEMPDDDERQEYKARPRLVLETREEVQAFVNLMSKMQKEQNNG